MDNQTNTKQDLRHKIFSIVGIVLCAILLPMLIINIIMIINSYTSKDEVPSVGKYVPFIIQSGSMAGTIEGGDIIITTKVEPEEIKIDDIITFYDPKGNGTSTVTHRVINIEEKDGTLIFTTVGDVVLNENIEKYGDFESIPEPILNVICETVSEDKVISRYKFRIPLLGHVSLFMSTIPGFIVCVLLPLLLLVGYDVVRRKINDKANDADKDALLAELEALRAEKQAKEEQTDSNEETE
ncbi:MAG: signal peptidase I [Erysipelotrichaceae bacterium]|nr:signal peptidase I [Erysipelotrichaceae bacterium]